MKVYATSLALLIGSACATCPYLAETQNEQAAASRKLQELVGSAGDGGIPEGGYEAVKADLTTLLTDSQDFWPGDFETPHGPHYGGLFIRLAWHCSGSYRQSDGRGGCDGGRIRFEPEFKWEDNGNLDKALKLLEPIKEKYGSQLSWGDLIVLSGTVAIEAMGGPSLGFCGGRIDDGDGSNSLRLGPSPEQEEVAPCRSLVPDMQGTCLAVDNTALGPTTVGLIYVNPAGPKGAVGDPVASGEDIRTAFSRMGFNDTETVSLIGGGHAFGKAHGACNSTPCGEGDLQGKGPNTFTSGFEGQWTATPTTWTNDYFNSLFDLEWESGTGPGGALQWAPVAADAPDIFMLTSDVALVRDTDYTPISQQYADDITTLEADFAASWYRLTTQDMGPRTRCIGDDIPPLQPWQAALPDPPSSLPDYVPVREKIQSLLDVDEANHAAFVGLAYNCASTYRSTDHRGGCNGARVRFSPEKEWDAGNEAALATLDAVKQEYPDVSFADIIVLAGQVALEDASSLSLDFCGGRVDASDAMNSEPLAPREYSDPVVTIRDDMQVKGLDPKQGIALMARNNLGSAYFSDMVDAGTSPLLDDADFRDIIDTFASDEVALLESFSMGWTYMMTVDRYSNNVDNACTGVSTPTKSDGSVPATPDTPAAAPTSSASSWFMTSPFLAIASLFMV